MTGVDWGEERVNTDTVEDIDERRLHRKAYDYLCRLQEVRTWLMECLKDDTIASVTELENNFRNGVLLARLGHSFAPEIVTARSIYDTNQEIYHANDNIPKYRHTDNIVLWRRSMLSVRLPEIIIPEPADVFEGRNMKTTFCLYALATLLYRLRKAPPLRNLTGKAQFSKDELEEIAAHIKDSKVPEFGDVGGLLSDRMTPDEKAHTIAIFNINRAIESKDESLLLDSLQQPDAGIHYVEKDLSASYLHDLIEIKESDIHDNLGRDIIQKTINATNNKTALTALEELLQQEGDVDGAALERLFDTLQFEDVRSLAVPLYVKLLRNKRQQQEEQLTRDQVEQTIQVANALVEVKLAVLHGSSEDTFKTLNNPLLELRVRKENSKLYHNRLLYNYQKSTDDFFLSTSDLANILYEFEDISTDRRKLLELTDAIKKKDEQTLEILLRELCGTLFIEENMEFYWTNLRRKKIETLEDLQSVIKDTNNTVHKAFGEADALIRLNHSMFTSDHSGVRLNLLSVTSSNGCVVFRRELVHWYINRLIQEARARKPEPQQNGHSERREEWYWHEFTLGTIWVETEEHTRSTKRRVDMENEIFFHWGEIEAFLIEENNNFTQHYKVNEESVVKSQEAMRHFLERKRKKEEEKEQKRREEAAATIRNSYRKYKHKKDTNELQSSSAPTLPLVRKFVKELQKDEHDINEELVIEEKKSEVIQFLVSNQKLDANLTELDEKIGLLVKNRISLQDVIAHRDKIDADKRFTTRPASVRKRERDVTARLEQLFYHLQTDSYYMANLILGKRKETDGFNFLNDCVLPSFGFVTEVREEFLLVRVLCELMSREIGNLGKSDGFLESKGNIFVKEALAACIKSDPCSSLEAELKEFLEDESTVLSFNLNPDEIFHDLYAKKAESTQIAVNDEKVNRILESSKNLIAKWSEKLVNGIIRNFKLPPALLYLCRYLEDILLYSKNGTKPHEERPGKIIAEFAYQQWLHGAICNSRLLFRATGTEFSDDAKRKLECVAQFIGGYAIPNRGYGNSHWYLTSLNAQIHRINETFCTFVLTQTRGCDLNSIYNMNEYTHFDPSHKPMLTLLERPLTELVNYLKANITVISPDPESRMTRMIRSATIPKDSETDKSIILYLHPAREDTNNEQISQELFVRTKKYVLDLLLSDCIGNNITQLITLTPTDHNEQLHHEKYNPEKMKDIEEKQKQIAQGLATLETMHKVSNDNDYQAIVTDIANDIRLNARRERERAEQKRNLEETHRQLESQRNELEERLERYKECLDTCLDNLTKTSRRLSFRPNTKEAEKIQKQRRSLDAIQSYKSTVEKLFRKGILIDVGGEKYKAPNKLTKVSLDISSTEEKGIFKITILEGKDTVHVVSLDFQDLLKSSACAENRLNVGDMLVFDVPHTIEYFNKKFFNK